MHQISDKVREFWEKQGYVIEPRFSLQPDPVHSVLWDACKNETRGELIYRVQYYTIAITFYEDTPSAKYFLENETYSEEEILRIYKMKAFI